MINKILIIFFSLLLFSCGKNEVYNKVIEYPNQIMNWDKSADFEFKVEEENLSSYLYIQHNNSYPFQNIYFFSKVEFPDGNTQEDTLQYMLAKPSGEWLGGGMGASKQIYLHYPLDLSQRGDYKVKVWQAMRKEELAGVEKLAFSIQKNEN